MDKWPALGLFLPGTAVGNGTQLQGQALGLSPPPTSSLHSPCPSQGLRPCFSKALDWSSWELLATKLQNGDQLPSNMHTSTSQTPEGPWESSSTFITIATTCPGSTLASLHSQLLILHSSARGLLALLFKARQGGSEAWLRGPDAHSASHSW